MENEISKIDILKNHLKQELSVYETDSQNYYSKETVDKLEEIWKIKLPQNSELIIKAILSKYYKPDLIFLPTNPKQTITNKGLKVFINEDKYVYERYNEGSTKLTLNMNLNES